MQWPEQIHNGQVMGFTYHDDPYNPACLLPLKPGCQVYEQAQVFASGNLLALTPFGGQGFRPIAQADDGTVVGTVTTPGQSYGAAWIGSSHALVTLSNGYLITPTALNAVGQVVGTYTVSGVTHGVLIDGVTGGRPTYTDLGAEGAPLSLNGAMTTPGPTAINASGAVAGWANQNGHAAPWTYAAGRLTRLPLPKPWVNGVPAGINSSGMVAGNIDRPDPKGPYSFLNHAAVWQGGKLVDLGTLGGRDSYIVGYIGNGDPNGNHFLSDDGSVIGWSLTGPTLDGASFVWSGGTLHDLDPSPTTQFDMVGIDKQGEIAGSLANASNPGPGQPVLWRNGTFIDLVPAGGNYLPVQDVDDSGNVLGLGTTSVVWHVGP